MTLLYTSISSTSTPCLLLLTVKCPPGSYGFEGECHVCAVGEYQDVEGQVTCIRCPKGLTTLYNGSTNASHCNGIDLTLFYVLLLIIYLFIIIIYYI